MITRENLLRCFDEVPSFSKRVCANNITQYWNPWSMVRVTCAGSSLVIDYDIGNKPQPTEMQETIPYISIKDITYEPETNRLFIIKKIYLF